MTTREGPGPLSESGPTHQNLWNLSPIDTQNETNPKLDDSI